MLFHSRSFQVLNFRPLSSLYSRPQQQGRRPVIGLNSFMGHFWSAFRPLVFKRSKIVARERSLEELRRITLELKRNHLLPGLLSCQVCSTQNYYKEKQPEWWLEYPHFFPKGFITNCSGIEIKSGDLRGILYSKFLGLSFREKPVTIAAQPWT